MWSHLNCIVNLNFTLFCHKSSNLGKMHLEFWLIVVKYSPLTSCPQFLVVTLGLQNTQFNQIRKSKPIKDEYVNIEFHIKYKIQKKAVPTLTFDCWQLSWEILIFLWNIRALHLETRWEFLGAVSFNLVWPGLMAGCLAKCGIWFPSNLTIIRWVLSESSKSATSSERRSSFYKL